MKKYDCEILIGTISYNIKVSGKKIDGKVHYETEALIDGQKELAIELLQETTSDFNIDIFNFVINVAGIKGSELASLMGSTPSSISQARRGKTPLSKTAWKLFTLVMMSYLSKDQNRAIDKMALKPAA